MNYENLSERKKQILYNAIDDYIQNASPITSGSVHEKHLNNISPATLRNELSALEAMGYLKQLHTSSGRIPTTKAYRLYVNELMGKTRFDKKTLQVVRDVLTKRTIYLTDIVNSIAGAVSEATNYPSVVILNGYDKLSVESIKIIPLIDGSGLLLIGTKNGIVNGQLSLPSGITEENCVDASNLLTKSFSGKTIKEMRENIYSSLSEITNEIKVFEKIFNSLLDCLTELINQKQNIVRAGETKLLNNPEYKTIENAKKVLDVLSNEDELTEIFNRDDDSEITFTIGKENRHEGLENCSVVKANYVVNGNNIASIGVIGPERMDYSSVASALKVIVAELDKLNYLPSVDTDKGGK